MKKPLTHRYVKKHQNKQKYLSKKNTVDENCTFAPTVDGRSERIFEQLKGRKIEECDVFQRLSMILFLIFRHQKSCTKVENSGEF